MLRVCFVLYVAAAMGSAQTFTTIANFDLTDGAFPYYGPRVQATNGNLFGTTWGGGLNNDGTVFEMTPSGKLTTLHSFNSTDGAFPGAWLIQATNGYLYGTSPGRSQ